MANPLHVSVLIDRSGSMSPLREQVLEGVNDLFAEQRSAAGAVSALMVTLAQFHTKQPFSVTIDAVPIAKVRDLEWDDFQPSGGTPLFDAIGRLIERLDERPDGEDQFVALVTDGKENASTDFTAGVVRELISERRKRGWTFVFLGANQDSFQTAGGMGMARGNTRNFAASDNGTRRAFSEVNKSVLSQRGRTSQQRRSAGDDLLAEHSDEDDLLS